MQWNDKVVVFFGQNFRGLIAANELGKVTVLFYLMISNSVGNGGFHKNNVSKLAEN